MINWPQETGLARQRISSYLLQTPLEYADSLSRETGAEVYLKLEMLQLTGSFKLRGAANKLLSLSSSDLRHGVITASTGNHGAGVLHIARQLGVPVRVFLPKTAFLSPEFPPKIKTWQFFLPKWAFLSHSKPSFSIGISIAVWKAYNPYLN